MILTTPDEIDEQTFQHINTLFTQWVTGSSEFPLIIGRCKVMVTAMPPNEGSVQRVSL
ncbi:MAG TPA: hypothetical protein VFP22_00535 [Candidatus Limnocylindrales bacterium]|nr:hypothetical protein [Candidatus Limnocylindrales bacterium]